MSRKKNKSPEGAPDEPRRKRVYIAHPLEGKGSGTWGRREYNVERYLRFCSLAMKRDFVVLSWIHQELTHQRGLTDGDAAWYLSFDRELLLLADEVWACCPEGVSAGSDTEVAWAREAGIKVVRKDLWQDPNYMPPREACKAKER